MRASGGGKDAPLLVVCVASKQKEGEKLKKRKEGEKLKKQKEVEKFRLLFPRNNELLKKQPTLTNHQIEKKRR